MTANVLTFFRIFVLIPFSLLFFCDTEWAIVMRVSLFAFATISDFLDGYIARRWQQETPLGRFLDPIADKLLIITTLFMLVGTNVIGGWMLIPSMAIIVRELIVSGLREFLSASQVSIPVSYASKWKTGIQMLSLTLLLIPGFLWIGCVLLCLAAILTCMTAYDYIKESVRYLL